MYYSVRKTRLPAPWSWRVRIDETRVIQGRALTKATAKLAAQTVAKRFALHSGAPRGSTDDTPIWSEGEARASGADRAWQGLA